MRFLELVVCLVLVVAPVVAVAQVERVFKNNEINESGLVDALLPSTAKGAQGPMISRSFRVTPEAETKTTPIEQPSVSMLVTFETNSAELSGRAKELLDTLGRALRSDELARFSFVIEGHADPRGGEQFNLQLSQRRAEKVVSYLWESQNVDRGRLTAVGRGQSQLINKDSPFAPENRRVTVKTVVQ